MDDDQHGYEGPYQKPFVWLMTLCHSNFAQPSLKHIQLFMDRSNACVHYQTLHRISPNNISVRVLVISQSLKISSISSLLSETEFS